MTDTGRGPVRFLVFSAALREQSLNSRLARLAAQMIEEHGGTVDLARMAEFDVPSYDQDVQDGVGFPPGAEEFRRRLEASDALTIDRPEDAARRDTGDALIGGEVGISRELYLPAAWADDLVPRHAILIG